MSVSLEESYRQCCQIARRTAKNFYYSFLVMPREKRRAMCAIYAFMRRSDDIADSAANPAVALDGLRQWRAQVNDALSGKESQAGTPMLPGNEILPALVDTVQRYGIPRPHFQELLDGTEMDQTTTRYATFDQLYQYCYRVASAVGLIVLPIFGYKNEAALVPAEACGIAFQLTNILRDVKEDARLGRIYLPLEDLKKFGIAENEIIDASADSSTEAGFHSRFVELMKFEAVRAHGFYEKAQPLLKLIDADSRGTLAVMIGIYGGILRKIELSEFAVFDSRLRLSTAEKLWIVLKNWGRKS
ncbi:MAG TPA: phytoene/squalene synthase family protein [Verrucomicrobiae bacterium]|nr:phytoene/squalene synthase family protein [Verrucomicrobiae bacterium]